MKVACISVNEDILIGKMQDNITEYLAKNLLKLGVTLNKISVISSSYEQLSNEINNNDYDVTFIIGNSDPLYNFKIKSDLCDCWGEKLVKDDLCVQTIESLKSKNITPISDIENEFFIPDNSLCLPNNVWYLQGFAYNGDNLYVFLPGDKDSVEYIFNNSIMPLIITQLKTSYKNITIKTFGINEKDVLKSIDDLIRNKVGIIITTYPTDLEVSISLNYDASIQQNLVNMCVSQIYERLRKYIYTDEDTNLYQLALDLLTISNNSLSICETITGGNISSEFNKCTSPSKHLLQETIVLNNKYAKNNFLNLNNNIIMRYGEISVECAYEMAANLLEKSESDLVVITCGNIDNENGVCYIAVGDNDGIHVYKNSYSGSRDQIIATVSKCAVFYLIKKLKQNDLFFNQYTV